MEIWPNEVCDNLAIIEKLKAGSGKIGKMLEQNITSMNDLSFNLCVVPSLQL